MAVLTETGALIRKPERSSYTSLDFLGWSETGALVLSPKFQRRDVWTTPARSYLMESLLLGMPVPPIFLRVRQNEAKRKIIREVVDGQQRISAVLDFLTGEYALSLNVRTAWSGKYFDDLDADDQDRIRNYSFICEVFSGLEDVEVLQIFARLNTYSVPLNLQELRNGRVFGPFKQSAYEIAYQHLEFWRAHKIAGERQIARMGEVELTSELMIQEIDGLQDKKKSIDAFYLQYDKTFPQRLEIESRFRAVIDEIGQHTGTVLRESEFRRVPLFYSLFGVVFHRMFGMPHQEVGPRPLGKLRRDDGEKIRDTVLALSEVVSLAKQGETTPSQFDQFINACLRQTDNIRPRQLRFSEIYSHAFA